MCPSRALAPPARAGRVLLGVWVVALSLLVLGPALGPGHVLSYDMVWVPDLSLARPDVWGLGSGLPRAVPSDAVVALLGAVLPQQLVQKALLLAALIGAGAGGARLVRGLGPVAPWAAATLMIWNPFVAERLGLGHWPLLLAYAATPWLFVMVRDRRFATGTLLLAVTALTPASGVMGALLALVTGRLRDAWRWLLLALAVNAPWIVASLVSPAALSSDPAGVSVFAARGAGSTPVWLEVLSLGGVWNADVRPPSRETVVATVLAVVLVGLVVAGWIRLWRRGDRDVRRLVALAVIGLVVALAGATAPSLVSSIVETVPGAGLLRDGSRWVLLAAPGIVVGFAAAVAAIAARSSTTALGWAVALLLPVALVPDLGWGLAGRLQAVDYPDDWDRVAVALREQGEVGDLVSLPFSAFRAPDWNAYRPVLDPAGRYFDRVTVTDDTLRVGATAIAGEDPRAGRVGRAIEAGDWDAVAREGVGFVVLDTSAPGGDAAQRQVADLPEVARAGDLVLLEVPGATDPHVEPGRRWSVVGGWLVAATAVVLASVASIRRIRSVPSRR